MEEHVRAYGSSMDEYIKMQTKMMNEQPEMAMFKDETADLTYILVSDTPENVEKFRKYLKKYNLLPVPDNVLVFYNEPYYYELAIDGSQTRYRIKKEKERQARLDNPRVWQEVKDIETKEQLIEYFMDYWYSTNDSNIWEYSSDLEVSEKELEVSNEELNKKVKELL